MHKITYFPVGNADTCLITLENGKNILIDFYAVKRDEEDKEDLRADVPKLLKEILKEAKKDYIDIVAFTHLDEDHYKGFSDFFYLEHAKKYQEGERIKINELWVPAAGIIDTDLPEEAKILRSEARYRLANTKNLKVFSMPDPLQDWLKENDIDYESVKNIIIHAGGTVVSLNKENDGVEFFTHAPFSDSIDGVSIDRNNAALTFQATFFVSEVNTKLMIGSDTEWDTWVDIVKITKHYKRLDKLEWDIFDISHHSSHTGLAANKEDIPKAISEEINELFEMGEEGAKLISQSNIKQDKDAKDAPYIGAVEYYEAIAENIKGEYKITMEYPKPERPKPLVILIGKDKATIEKINTNPIDNITLRPAPIAGA
ncbi:MAG: hypothetical protein KKG02_10660 [Candidatus Edwardsbacteria bacterium]|nr:hypothetical protein [Candidatus Edwardsbacteria bacterium]